MQISGFANYDEARQYANAIYQQENIKLLLPKTHSLIISEENLELLGVSHSYEEYEKFYTKHYAPLKISKLPLLIEPRKEDSDTQEESSPTETSTPKVTGNKTEEILTEEKQKEKEEDTGIYFDDDNATDNPRIEDEYYDLKGF